VPPSTHGTPTRLFSASNTAPSPGKRRSHQQASSIPPPTQYPSIAAMVGLPGSSHENLSGAVRSPCGLSIRPSMSRRSAPAQKASVPAPATTSTRASSSRPNASMAEAIPSAVAASMQFRTAGRSIVKIVTGPRRSTRAVWGSMARHDSGASPRNRPAVR
jgi:hypothetical protein